MEAIFWLLRQLWRVAVRVLWICLSPVLWIWRRIRVRLPRPAFLSVLQLPCELTYDLPENQPEPQLTRGQELLHWCLGILQWCLVYIRLFFWSIDLIPVRDFKIYIRTTGKTHACERQFLKDVSKHLFWDVVSLKVNTMVESPEDFLLVFCPIASRMGTDIENALEGLKGRQNTILVVMHYVQKDDRWTFVDVISHGRRPDVVLTVHTRYTRRDGLYPCEMNVAAVADVAAAIKDLLRPHCGSRETRGAAGRLAD